MSDTVIPSVFPVLPLRDIVVFPHMIVPLFVGREKSIRALEAVMAEDKQIALRAERLRRKPSFRTSSYRTDTRPTIVRTTSGVF